MDIDSPDSSPDGLVSPFSVVFPLPFRVLALVGLGGLCWATNLQLLDFLGVDSAQALQIPHTKAINGLPSHSPPHSAPPSPFPGATAYAHPSTLYPPVYRLVATYATLVGGGWLLFYLLTQGDPNALNASKWVPAICYTVLLVAAIIPLHGVYGIQRSYLYQSLYRCLFSTPAQPVYFCDVIAADVLTSFAKVFGDIWISIMCLLPGGSLKSAFPGGFISDMAVPVLLSVPYAIRLRQCIVEFLGSGGKSQRPMYNAVKYATAFPVIFLSAAQRLVNEENDEDRDRTWYGESAIFRLWLLSVFVNSAYSFWWDVTNDWGLVLLKRETWSKDARDAATASAVDYQLLSQSSSVSPRAAAAASASAGGSPAPATAGPGHAHLGHTRKASSFSALPLSSPLPHLSSGSSPNGFPTSPFTNGLQSPNPYSSAFTTQNYPNHPWGLRSPLLFRDPSLYYLVVLLNFVLRFTWSLKLSSHLHSVAELESGVFLMEALELIRRWMWVFFRVEWELVKKMNGEDGANLFGRSALMQSVNGGLSSHGGGGGISLHHDNDDNIEMFRFPNQENGRPSEEGLRLA